MGSTKGQELLEIGRTMDNDRLRPLAHKGSSMFERNLAMMVSRGSAVVIELVDGRESQEVGFVAGLDEQFIQLCNRTTGEQKLIFRQSVNVLYESTLTIADIEDEEVREIITRRTNMFKRV